MSDFVEPVVSRVEDGTVAEAEVDSDCEAEQRAEKEPCPAHRIVTPADIFDISPTDEAIVIVGTQQAKVTRIAGLEGMTELKVLFDSFSAHRACVCLHLMYNYIPWLGEIINLRRH